MKITFISLLVITALISLTGSASADRLYEKKTSVISMVVTTKTGFELASFQWVKPTSTLIKTCAEDDPATDVIESDYECVYEIRKDRKGRTKEVFLFDYACDELTFAAYKFQEKAAKH